MGANQTDIVRGTLDMLILKTLSLQPMHGLGISHRMEQITDGAFQAKPGSLFPAFHRLDELIDPKWCLESALRVPSPCVVVVLSPADRVQLLVRYSVRPEDRDRRLGADDFGARLLRDVRDVPQVIEVPMLD